MNPSQCDASPVIDAGMTILDVVSRYQQTEAVFKQYDETVGECLWCRALFEPLNDVADKYGLDLNRLIADLRVAAAGESGDKP
ncbi:MAG: hypothetical protein V1792_13085 [Pseudomonadota bacterium]